VCLTRSGSSTPALTPHLRSRKTTPRKPIEALTDRIRAARNPSVIVPKSGLTPETNAVYLERRQADYIQWAETPS
jgi:hypothetical protein